MVNKNNFYIITLLLALCELSFSVNAVDQFTGKTIKEIASYLNKAIETNDTTTIQFTIDQVNKKSAPDIKNNPIVQKFINVALNKISELSVNNEAVEKLQYTYLKSILFNLINGKNIAENATIIQLLQIKIDLEAFLNKEDEEKELIIEEMEFDYPDFIYNETESEKSIINTIDQLTARIQNEFIKLSKQEQVSLLKTSSNDISLELFNSLSLKTQTDLYNQLKTLDDFSYLSSQDVFIAYQKELLFERLATVKTVDDFNAIINDAQSAELTLTDKEQTTLKELFNTLKDKDRNVGPNANDTEQIIKNLEAKLNKCQEKNHELQNILNEISRKKLEERNQ